MTQTTFTDNVVIQGSRDIAQLVVQDTSGQAQPLQIWENSSAGTLAQLNADGRLLLGTSFSGAADALLQVTYSPTGSQPNGAWHAAGTVTSPGTPVNWVFHELQLAGTSGTQSLHNGLYTTLTNNNTGFGTATEVRAATFQAINLKGASNAPLGKLTGLEATATNSGTAYAGTMVAVAAGLTNATAGSVVSAVAFSVVPPVNSGTISALYGLQIPDLTAGRTSNTAISTGKGVNTLGDSLTVTGSQDTKQLVVKGNATQTNTLQEWQTSAGNAVAGMTAGGALGLGTNAPAQLLDLTYGHQRFSRLAAPATPTVAVNAVTGNLNGAYQYAVTLVTAAGETELSSLSATVSPANQQVNVTAIPTGPSGVVTARNLYRTIAGGSSMYPLATISDNTTTTYTDNTADGSLNQTLAYNYKENTTSGEFYLDGNLAGWVSTSNTALGNNALNTTNVAAGNTALGNYALNSNTSGQFNTTVGNYAMRFNTSGQYNAAVGYSALESNTTGANNVATGPYALSNNTTGSSNVAVGNNALSNINTGNDNVGIGANAATGISTGFGNVAIGPFAGDAINTGSSNTFVGVFANASGDLSNATAIGASAQVSASNSLVLGNGANVGIGVSAPAYTLDIAGNAHIAGSADAVQAIIQGNSTQTHDLQEWQTSAGTVLASVSQTGKLTVPAFAMTTSPTNGFVMTSDGSGNGTWQAPGGNAVCNGRLTLTSGTPITTSDVTAAGTVYFTPFGGNVISLYSGSVWQPITFAETSLSLSGLNANTAYDIFGYNNSGVLALEALAWNAPSGATNITAATNATPIVITTSAAHGLSNDQLVTITGVGGNTAANGTWRVGGVTSTTFQLLTLAGGNSTGNGAYTSGGTWQRADQNTSRATALSLQNGIYVKSSATTRRYLGTIRITTTAGQSEDSAKRRFVWNYYNRVLKNAIATESSVSGWTYGSAAWRASNNSLNNRVEVVVGVSENIVKATALSWPSNGASTDGSSGIGLDATNANNAQIVSEFANAITTTSDIAGASPSYYSGYPGVGYHYFQWLEYSRSGTPTYYGNPAVTIQTGIWSEEFA